MCIVENMAKEIHVSGIRCYLLPSKVRRYDNADTWDTLHFNIWRVVYKTSVEPHFYLQEDTRALGPSPASSVVGRTVAQQPHPHRPIPAHTTDPQLHNLHMPIRWGDGAMKAHLSVLVSFNMHHFHVKDQIAVGWNDGTKTLVPVRHGTGDVQP